MPPKPTPLRSLVDGVDPEPPPFVGPQLPGPPLEAWQKAETIGPPRVGDRYLPTEAVQKVQDIFERFFGPARPTAVNLEDPYGITAWEMGAGPPPLMMGTLAEKPKAPLNAPVERVGGRLVISTRVPRAKNLPPHEPGAPPLVSGVADAAEDPGFFAKMAQAARDAPMLTGREKRLSDPGVVKAFVNRAAENTDALVAMEPPAVVKASSEWYPGAQRISDANAAAVGVSPDAGAALMASQSPSKEWPQNISLAQRIAHWWHDFGDSDPGFSQAHFDRFVQTTLASAEDWIVKKKLTGERAATTRARAARKIETARAYLDHPWSALPETQQAQMLRAHSELNEPQTYQVYSPEGKPVGLALDADGKPRTLVWQSNDNVKNGLSVLRDGTDANISARVGRGQKVRSFFNNINVPTDPRSFTVDTHNVGGAHLRPMGGKAPEVTQVMQGPGSASTGLTGFHPLYRDAGTLAAEARGMRPNQIQSVSWEGIKGLFSSAQRRNPDIIKQAKLLWQEYSRGKIPLEELHGRIFDLAATATTKGSTNWRTGLIPPEWQGR